MFLQHRSLHNIEAYLSFMTSPPLQVIYMLNPDQTIWVKTEVLLGHLREDNGEHFENLMKIHWEQVNSTPPPNPKEKN